MFAIAKNVKTKKIYCSNEDETKFKKGDSTEILKI